MELIAAHSPQAKGRVERLFKTFQDRLVKALRLPRIATLEAANRFLEDYLPIYNHRFAVRPAQAADLHRPRLPRRDLDHILCVKTTRVLRRDWTVVHNGHLYQCNDHVRTTHVLVEERVDGTLRLTHHGRALAFHPIAARPVSVSEAKPLPRFHRSVTPKPTHPWRKRWRPERGPHPATAGP